MNTTNLRFKSNRVIDIIQLFHEELNSQYSKEELDVFMRMLFEAFLNWDHAKLLISKNETINQSDLLHFHWALEDLKKQRPIQHITGFKYFCDHKIKVDNNVLIPRPETEELVGKLDGLSTKRIVDLCTGSGCIAIALKKKYPNAEVSAVDISIDALKLAAENAKANDTEIQLYQCDLLTDSMLYGHYGIIVSNPPYICESERISMYKNVLDYEPKIALFVPDDDPLIFYRRIIELAENHLSKDGIVAVEINERFGKETCELFEAKGFIPTLLNDFRDKPRMIIAHRNV